MEVPPEVRVETEVTEVQPTQRTIQVLLILKLMVAEVKTEVMTVVMVEMEITIHKL